MTEEIAPKSVHEPSPDEVELFTGTDIVIIRAIKHNPPNQPRTTTDYIRWRDVWDEAIYFRKKGSNNKLVWRAMALSMPAFHAHTMGTVDFQNMGFIVGIDMRIGHTPYQQVFEMSEVQWEVEPLLQQSQDEAE